MMKLKNIWLSCVSLLLAGGLHAALPETSAATVVPPTSQVSSKVSINKATQQQLEAIPGIGAKKAQAILEYIKAKGPIKTKEQVMEVKGIGEKMATRIAELVSFS